MNSRQWVALATTVAMLAAQVDFALAAACSATAANVAGQTIRLTVTFFTDDANEDGEGEPLIITSSGGFSVTQGSHVTMTYDVASTVDNEMFTAAFGGEAPDGDESCSLSTDTQKKIRLTPDQIRMLNDVINNLTLAGTTTTGTCALVCPYVPPFTPACAATCAVTVFGDALLAWRLRKLVNDPPDPNFTVLVTPTYTMVTCGMTGIPQNLNDTCDALYLADQHAIGLADAILQTFNKAQGAADAGDSVWEAQQMAHAADLESQLGDTLAQLPAFRANFQDALQGWGQFSQQPAASPADVFNAESILIFTDQDGCAPGQQQCFPIDPHATLAALGVTDPVDEENTIQDVITQDTQIVANIPTLPATLTWQPLIDSLNAMANVFRGKIGVDECWRLSQHRPYPGALSYPSVLTDRFGTARTLPRRGVEACFPAIAGPDSSLLSHHGETIAYQVHHDTRFTPRTLHVMSDLDLNGSDVLIYREDTVQIPATIPDWPNHATAIDGYFQCYKAKGRSLDLTLPQVSDGFALVYQPVSIRTPSHLCVPVNVNGLDPGAPNRVEGIACYRARAPLRPLGRTVSQSITEDVGPTVFYPNSATLSSYREYCVPAMLQ